MPKIDVFDICLKSHDLQNFKFEGFPRNVWMDEQLPLVYFGKGVDMKATREKINEKLNGNWKSFYSFYWSVYSIFDESMKFDTMLVLTGAYADEHGASGLGGACGYGVNK